MTDTHIKINAVTPRVQYTGNGSTTSFPYTFAIFDDSDMVVYVGDDIIETGYTVTGAGETEGGNVVFDTAPEDGVKITLLRNVPIERLTDFQEGGTFRPKNINDEFDRQTAFIQQVQEKIDRTLILPPTSEIQPEQILVEVERIYSSIDNVDTVADDITNVNAVAADLTNIDNIANDLTNIDAVADNKTNIDAVADNKTNIDAVNSNKTNIDNVAGNETNINTVAGNGTNINTVAGISSNVTTVATNISGVNTCASNISSILDAPTQAAAAADSAVLSAQYANDKINQTHISNCITKIPQDITLELSGGTLTLKSGSKVYVPNGSGVFDKMTTSADVTVLSSLTDGKNLIFDNGSFSGSSLRVTPISKCFSGNNAPANPQSGDCWYDTSNNLIKIYESSWSGKRSLPIAIVTVSGGTITSIDQVFNGFGYIGSSLFVLPGVKLLFAQGFNADGTLKSGQYTVSSVTVRTETAGTNTYGIAVGGNIGLGTYIYDSKTNYLYSTSISPTNKRPSLCLVGTTRVENGVIKSLDVNTVFHAVDYNDAVKYSDKTTVNNWGMPDYSAGVSLSVGTVSDFPVNAVAYVELSSATNTSLSVTIDGNDVLYFANSNGYWTKKGCQFIISKGSTVVIAGNLNMGCYYPLKGEL